MYNYTAFSLRIQSELFFPELIDVCDTSPWEAFDVSIYLGSVLVEGFSDIKSSGLYYQVKPDAFWLHVPNIARFLVLDGNKIIIDPVAGVDEDSLRVFVLAPCVAVLLMQRDVFVLQGAVVKAGEHAIAILGHSGAGKSSVAAALAKKKYSLLADEWCALNSELKALPAYPQMNIWFRRRIFQKIRAPWSRQIRPGIDKYGILLNSGFHFTPLPLKRMFILNPSKHHSHIHTTFLLGGDKISYLQKYMYNKTYTAGLGKDALHFKYAARLATNMDVVLIDWPTRGCCVKALANVIDEITREALYVC